MWTPLALERGPSVPIKAQIVASEGGLQTNRESSTK